MIKTIIKKLKKKIKKKHQLNTFGISETSKCRGRLSVFCVGNGLDLGFGGDPILNSSIRVDYLVPYAKVGSYPVQLTGDAKDLFWFNDNVLDYVYSSHLLEDFVDTEGVLREWLRVIKIEGNLVIYCPDEQLFRLHCDKTGQPYNPAHIHSDFSLNYVKRILSKIGNISVVYENNIVDIYSWELVVKKIR
jgi:hypothetical protein